jgi:hypothetical protein
MIDLERSLGELAARMEIPGDDRLVNDVVRRIGLPTRHPKTHRVPRLAGALAAVVIVVLVALPGPRHAVARWLGFDSVRIEPGVTVPTSAAPVTVVETATTVTVPAPVPDLGPAMSLDEAMSRTGLPDPAPTLLGDPQSVHVVRPPDSGQIVIVFAPSALVPQSDVTGVGALVSILPARIDTGLFLKTLGDTSTVRSVDVDGAVGYWIEGAPHQVMFEFDNEVEPDTLRLATNTLLWQRDDHVYRIEAHISLDTALQIAKSVP